MTPQELRILKQKQFIISSTFEDFLFIDKYRQEVKMVDLAEQRALLEHEINLQIDHNLLTPKYNIDEWLEAYYGMKDLFTRYDILDCIGDKVSKRTIEKLFHIHHTTTTRYLDGDSAMELTEPYDMDLALLDEMLLFCQIYAQSVWNSNFIKELAPILLTPFA